jgi:NADPH:quinone reductase-like Zn-dependent oxidoreductase
MKAAVYYRYGSPDVLELGEVEKPVPKDDEVLIKVDAASVNPLDWHFMRGTPLFLRTMSGLLRPKHRILGVDLAGRIEAVGRNVTQFQPGNEVFGASKFGALAEYVCTTEERLAPKPTTMTFEQAAAVPAAAITALQALRDHGKIQPEQKVLINGASGGVGTFAVQIAKSFGAEVTGVCSTRNVEMVRSIGADTVIDYTREDFTRNGQHYDLILDTAAYRSISDYNRILGPKGIYVMVGGDSVRMFQTVLLGPWNSLMGNRKIGFMIAKIDQKDLLFMKDLLEAGKVRPVIDRRYSLAEAAKALGYLEEGHAQGKVVVTV